MKKSISQLMNQDNVIKNLKQIQNSLFQEQENILQQKNQNPSIQNNKNSYNTQKQYLIKDNQKQKKTYIIQLIAVFIFLVAIYFIIDKLSFSQNSAINQSEKLIQANNELNIKNNELKKGQLIKKQQDYQQQQQFKIQHINTNFQGKQTQAQLSLKALQHMQYIYFNPINNKIDADKKKLLQQISNLQQMIPDLISNGNQYIKDMYNFKVSIKQMILNSQLDHMYQRGQKIFMISQKQHIRALLRTQMVHNINKNGQIQVELTQFDKSKQDKQKAIQLIQQDQQLYYQTLYHLKRFQQRQLRFCIVIPSYKNVISRLYLRNLDSIFMQDYDNYHIVYIDDASPDKTGQYVLEYIKQKQIPQQKIKVIINKQNKKAMYNIYHGIHDHCQKGEIVGLVDGDDSLLGRKVLKLYNAVYQDKKAAIVYSNFLKILTNNKTGFGFGTQVTRHFFIQNMLRTSPDLVATHFMTFYVDMFEKIKLEDLCYPNGTFYDYAYDRAIITPIIQMAFPRVVYLPEITYEYRNDTGMNDGSGDWERVSKIIQAKQSYRQLESFPFIDEHI